MLGSVLAATAATAALTAAGYQSMAPTGQWYGRTFTGLTRGTKQLALTYDDGPNDPHTLRLLEVLARHNVRATFFLIGRYVRQQTRYRSRSCEGRPCRRKPHVHASVADLQERN